MADIRKVASNIAGVIAAGVFSMIGGGAPKSRSARRRELDDYWGKKPRAVAAATPADPDEPSRQCKRQAERGLNKAAETKAKKLDRMNVKRFKRERKKAMGK